MKYFFLLMIISVLSCKKDVAEKPKDSLASLGSIQNELEVYDFKGLEKFLNKKDDKIYVINFWATWCKPCIKELPHFEKINSAYAQYGVEVILVSLDFPHLYDKKLKPFIIDNKLMSKVIALDDADMNTWIPKVSETWSGAIPATIIYNNESRKFFERSFTYQELEEEIKPFLK